MTKRVLCIGNCAPDQGQIERMLTSRFDVDVDVADTAAAAREQLARGDYDLVLMNRVFDLDGDSGIDLIHSLKQGDHAAPPMMLISNFDDAQQQAQAAGAEPGFGKARFDDSRVVARLAQYLG